ncbi:MAG: hypothetical protein IT260_23335 [Saprospiraceae bacterium]|nr:hypothetical protein [Saprospiraceae bacterium]
MQITFSELEYSERQQQLLDEYSRLQIVAETAILQPDFLTNDHYKLSKLAALCGMQIFADRFAAWVAKTNPYESPEDVFVINISTDTEPSGQQISFEEFIGPGYHIAEDRLALFNFLPERHTLVHEVTEGFAKALLDPPHDLALSIQAEMGSALYVERLNQALLDILHTYLREILLLENLSDTGHLVIHQWSDDWSNYFDSGKEWWGAFFWTVYDTQRQEITVIGASATD